MEIGTQTEIQADATPISLHLEPANTDAASAKIADSSELASLRKRLEKVEGESKCKSDKVYQQMQEIRQLKHSMG